MFARLAFVLVAMPCLAFAADAGGGAAKPPQPTAAKVEQGTTAPVRVSLTTPTAPTDPSDCRMTCAQTYYDCRAGDHPDECAGTWGQCVATCNSPSLAPGYSTAP